MLSAGQPGFVNAPVSKCVIALVVASTLFGSILGSQTRFVLDMDAVVKRYQLWRLVTHNFVFSTPGELLFGVVLLYFFRQFERQMGSSRFAALAFLTSTIYTALLSLILVLIPAIRIASGPYSLIVACLVYFYFETPKIYNFQILGTISLSDKSFAYLLALQLMLSSPLRSIIPIISALISGLTYRLPFVQENAEMPMTLVSVTSHLILPFLDTAPRPVQTASRTQRTRRPQNNAHPAATIAPFVAAHEDEHPPEVTEANVDVLVAMGFSREQSIAALERSGDDVQLATERLLNDTN